MANKKIATSRKSGSVTLSHMQVGLFALAFAVVGAYAVIASFASPPSRAGSGSINMSVVTDMNNDGLPNWGDTVTFKVTTSATSSPYVDLTCFQNGTLVYSATTGLFDSYPWPWTKDMKLGSSTWTGGAANCTATAYYFSGGHKISKVTVATMSFIANP